MAAARGTSCLWEGHGQVCNNLPGAEAESQASGSPGQLGSQRAPSLLVRAAARRGGEGKHHPEPQETGTREDGGTPALGERIRLLASGWWPNLFHAAVWKPDVSSFCHSKFHLKMFLFKK